MSTKKAIVKYNDKFESMIIAKAIELEKQGLSEGILDEKTLGGIIVYIDKVPALCMYKAVMKNDAPVLAGKTICAGADTI